MKLPETDLTATLKFNNRKDADNFAANYTRLTLMGHIVGSDNTVKVFNVTDDVMAWINNYVLKLNKSK